MQGHFLERVLLREDFKGTKPHLNFPQKNSGSDFHNDLVSEGRVQTTPLESSWAIISQGVRKQTGRGRVAAVPDGRVSSLPTACDLYPILRPRTIQKPPPLQLGNPSPYLLSRGWTRLSDTQPRKPGKMLALVKESEGHSELGSGCIGEKSQRSGVQKQGF